MLSFLDALLAQLVQDVGELALVQGVLLAGGLFAAGRDVHAEQRRAGDEDVARVDQLGEVAEEQREQ